VIDALYYTIRHTSPKQSLSFPAEKKMILVTAHRRENHGDALANILRALKKLAERDDVFIVYPVHPNPNVREPVYKILSDMANIKLLEPQDYVSFVHLMKQSYLILTDSGGIQEEAPSLGKPVLVMRATSERPEVIETGVAKLVGTDWETIFTEATYLLDDRTAYEAMSHRVHPYGDGTAARQIVQYLSM
jgi:UDP-N-acetylglucosamine 2-epimerase (non-hydrolysing)